jgi:hypothetical protein
MPERSFQIGTVRSAADFEAMVQLFNAYASSIGLIGSTSGAVRCYVDRILEGEQPAEIVVTPASRSEAGALCST